MILKERRDFRMSIPMNWRLQNPAIVHLVQFLCMLLATWWQKKSYMLTVENSIDSISYFLNICKNLFWVNFYDIMAA